MISNRHTLQALCALVMLFAGSQVHAQEPPAEGAAADTPAEAGPAEATAAEGEAPAEPAEDGEAPADAAATSESEGEGAEPAAAAAAEEPAAPPVKPRPAEMATLVPKRELLDVVNNGERLIAVGDRGGIIVSINGKDWAQVPAPVRSALTGLSFPDPKNGWAVGHDATILNTTDGGRTWLLQNFQAELEKPFLDVLFLDASRGFAVGAYGLFYQTADAGKQWTEVDAPAIRADEVHFNGITRLNDGSLFIAGEQGMLGISTDAGTTWEKITSPYDASLFGALPLGEKGAVIFGLRGNVYQSADPRAGGWTKIDTQTVASLFGGTVMQDGRMLLVGLNGAVLAIAPDGSSVRGLKVPVREVDRDGREKLKELSSALSAAIPFGEGVLLVGEEGVQRLGAVQ